MLFPSVGDYILKNTKDIIFRIFLPVILMGATRFSCPAGSVPSYIHVLMYYLQKKRRLLEKFQPDSFKTEKPVCVETDGQTVMVRSTRLVMLIKNLNTLCPSVRLTRLFV